MHIQKKLQIQSFTENNVQVNPPVKHPRELTIIDLNNFESRLNDRQALQNQMIGMALSNIIDLMIQLTPGFDTDNKAYVNAKNIALRLQNNGDIS